VTKTASIIIPTKNESIWVERTLLILSASMYAQEIIIADNDCDSKIKEVASRYSCRLIQDTTPAKSRNSGARASSGDILIFVDADVIVPPHCIDRAINIIQESTNVGIVHFKIVPITNSAFVRSSYIVMHYYFKMLSMLGVAQGIGNFIAVKREVFDEVEGFDESISAGEDADFFRRASKITSIVYLADDEIYASARRYHIEKPYIFSAKCVMWAMLRLFGSSRSIIAYKWECYPEFILNNEYKWIQINLEELHNKIIQPTQNTRG